MAKTLIQHALERRASLLLVGQSRMRWHRRLFGGGLASRLLRNARSLEINVLDSDDTPASPRLPEVRGLVWFDYALAVVATVVAAAMAWAVSSVLPLPNISLVFLAAVLLVAVRGSLGPSLVCAALSFLTYDFLFIPPNFSFAIQREEDVLTLLFFLLMAALTGNLAARQRRQLQALRDTQEETSELLDLSRKLTAATDRQAVVSAAAHHLEGWSDLDLCLLNRDGQGGWKIETGGPLTLSESERAAADWAWQHDQPAGMGTGTLPFGRWWWWPLSGEEGPLGLLGVSAKPGLELSGQRRRLLTALSQPLAQALARAQLAQELESARLHGETEQLRSALLASVSHDLRTPLTSMRGSIDSLLALGEVIPLEDRRELLEGTRDEAERLDRYIQNLLDMTRLGHGALEAGARLGVARRYRRQRPRPLASGAGAVAGEHRRAARVAVVVRACGADRAGPGECAGKRRAFFAAPGPFEIERGVLDNQLFFAVADEGPGIPEDERVKIFDMFYTAARGDRGGQGTGLGLAICQGMVGAHGGHISVADGIEGRGTCITLFLPLPTQPGLERDS